MLWAVSGCIGLHCVVRVSGADDSGRRELSRAVVDIIELDTPPDFAGNTELIGPTYSEGFEFRVRERDAEFIDVRGNADNAFVEFYAVHSTGAAAVTSRINVEGPPPPVEVEHGESQFGHTCWEYHFRHKWDIPLQQIANCIS